MSNLFYALPSILLIGSANAILKWRSSVLASDGVELFSDKPLSFVLDPFIFAGALATLLSVLWWLKIVSRVQVSVVYPMIQGGAIITTLVLASVFLSESLRYSQLAGIVLIICGITFLSSSL